MTVSTTATVKYPNYSATELLSSCLLITPKLISAIYSFSSPAGYAQIISIMNDSTLLLIVIAIYFAIALYFTIFIANDLSIL